MSTFLLTITWYLEMKQSERKVEPLEGEKIGPGEMIDLPILEQ